MTRWFSWGPYTEVAQAAGVDRGAGGQARGGGDHGLPHRRPVGRGARRDRADGDRARDRRATVGSWLGRSYWGSGANFEAKAMIAALAFQRLGRRAADGVGEHAQRALAAGAGARGVPARGRAARVAPARRRDARRRRVRASAGCVGAERRWPRFPCASRARRRPRSSWADARVRCVASTQVRTASAATIIEAVICSLEDERRPEQGEHGLGELRLADLGHAAERQAAVPGEEAQEHADAR